ncbi:MAG: phenylacetate-CoA oxygenase/reductase subunit PaaK [Candidatus Dormibacteraeota bacterium]|nr:phenylacetate-CoA oxygenase/reductase subunit PaaK [Candidatus Dormibacteraeota bacterium]
MHPLRVAAIEPITNDSVVIEFDVPPELAEDYDFVQGQHVSLRCDAAGDDVRRSYSVCSAAGSGRLRIAVKCLPGGVFSTYARDRLRPGDELEVVTPTGHFNTTLDPTARRSYAMMAAGSGIVPVFSIIATVLEREPMSSVVLLYGNRTVADIMFLEELEDLKNLHPGRFALYNVLSREEQEIPLFHGRIDADRIRTFLDELVPPPSVDEWFLCGPRPMIDAAREVLQERGVDSAHVHAELFHTESIEMARTRPQSDAATVEAGRASSQVTIILDGRRSSFTMDRERDRVLDAALRVRSDAPYACKGGVCGTCRAKLLEGTVEMEQCFALEQSELDAGFVLTCQSHPTSDRVVLDFDQ